uniref:hypothetical protein n=1 Tax=Carboxylicivirga caseinilyticus TaxID=3417572 RepID=UPI003D32B267|nr:hypothetical protein [Marinilabiliaceae bacterium A049]
EDEAFNFVKHILYCTPLRFKNEGKMTYQFQLMKNLAISNNFLIIKDEFSVNELGYSRQFPKRFLSRRRIEKKRLKF